MKGLLKFDIFDFSSKKSLLKNDYDTETSMGNHHKSVK
jgi:hypothetical protein